MQVINLKESLSWFVEISNTLPEWCYYEQSRWETAFKRVVWNLIYLINYLEEIKNATWLSNTYIPNTKDTFP